MTWSLTSPPASPGRLLSPGHHRGGLCGDQSGWNLEDSLRGEVDECLQKNRALIQERDYSLNQLESLKEENVRLSATLSAEMSAHKATRDELRQFEAKAAAARAELRARMEAEMSWRDAKLTEKDSEITRLNRLEEHVKRVFELESSKYDEITKLKAQLEAERRSSQMTTDSLERESSSLQRQVDYAATDYEREKERGAARLREEVIDHRRDIDDARKMLDAERKEHVAALAAVRDLAAAEKASYTKALLKKDQEISQLKKAQQELERAMEQERAEHAQEVAKLQESLKKAHAARRAAEAHAASLEPSLAQALEDAAAFEKRALHAEGMIQEWAEQIAQTQAAMDAALRDVDSITNTSINADLPAVYQVHALEPLVQVKVDEVKGSMRDAFARQLSNIRVHLPMP